MHYSTPLLSTLLWADLYTRNRVKQRSICTPLCAAILSPFFFFSLFTAGHRRGLSKVVARLAFRDRTKPTIGPQGEEWSWRKREKDLIVVRIASHFEGINAISGSREASFARSFISSTRARAYN